jgi:SAM-dependent methyltransferase
MHQERRRAPSGRTAVVSQKLDALRRKVVVHSHLVWPPVGLVRFGRLRRLRPVSRVRGADRGSPIDRYYIRHFLARYSGQNQYVLGDIRGQVLEVGDDTYTRMFGSAVTKLDILHADSSNANATIIADLAEAANIPSNTYDCVICTQVLLLIYDFRAAVHHLHRILKPNGILLATLPGISHVCRPDADLGGDYWRFTTWSVRRLFGEFFAPENVVVDAYGNVLTAIAFLAGVAAEELKREELDARDPDYEVLVVVRAQKQAQQTSCPPDGDPKSGAEAQAT